MNMRRAFTGVFGLLTLTAAAHVNAATYYFADCAAGAVAACVSGSNTNPGTDPSMPKKDMTGMKQKGGDVYRFARGGAWAGVQLRIFAPDSTRSAPTTFEDYTPTWGSTAPRPVERAGSERPERTHTSEV